jgi:RNA polymerase sigma factor (sigma-70 family)
MGPRQIPASGMAADSSFVSTRWSVVARAGGASGDDASAALAWLVERYWDPLRRAAARWGCDEHEADDAVQDFCCRLIERRADLSGLAPERGRFRAWLVVVFRNFLCDRVARLRAAKRGGAAATVDAVLADPAAPAAPDPVFDRDWAQALLGRASDRLAAEHATSAERARYGRLSRFLTANASGADYSAAGAPLGLSEGAVKVAVHRLRQRLKELARLEIVETLADPTPEAVEDELRTLAEALAGRSA